MCMTIKNTINSWQLLLCFVCLFQTSSVRWLCKNPLKRNEEDVTRHVVKMAKSFWSLWPHNLWNCLHLGMLSHKWRTIKQRENSLMRTRTTMVRMKTRTRMVRWWSTQLVDQSLPELLLSPPNHLCNSTQYLKSLKHHHHKL